MYTETYSNCYCCGCCPWGRDDINIQWFYGDPSGGRQLCNCISTMSYIESATGWYCQQTFPGGTLGFNLRCDNGGLTLYVQSGVYESANGFATARYCNCMSFGAMNNGWMNIPQVPGGWPLKVTITPFAPDESSGCITNVPCCDVPDSLTLTYTRNSCTVAPTGLKYISGSGLTGTIPLYFMPNCGIFSTAGCNLVWGAYVDNTGSGGFYPGGCGKIGMGPYKTSNAGSLPIMSLYMSPAPCTTGNPFYPCMTLNGPVNQTVLANKNNFSCSPLFLEFDNAILNTDEIDASGNVKTCSFNITITE